MMEDSDFLWGGAGMPVGGFDASMVDDELSASTTSGVLSPDTSNSVPLYTGFSEPFAYDLDNLHSFTLPTPDLVTLPPANSNNDPSDNSDQESTSSSHQAMRVPSNVVSTNGQAPAANNQLVRTSEVSVVSCLQLEALARSTGVKEEEPQLPSVDLPNYPPSLHLAPPALTNSSSNARQPRSPDTGSSSAEDAGSPDMKSQSTRKTPRRGGRARRTRPQRAATRKRKKAQPKRVLPAIDDSDEEPVDMSRLSKSERNKLSASKYRKRRKKYLANLEAKVSTLEADVVSHENTITSIRSENSALKEQVAFLKKLLASKGVAPKTTSMDVGAPCAFGSTPPTNAISGPNSGRRSSRRGKASAVLFVLFTCFLFSRTSSPSSLFSGNQESSPSLHTVRHGGGRQLLEWTQQPSPCAGACSDARLGCVPCDDAWSSMDDEPPSHKIALTNGFSSMPSSLNAVCHESGSTLQSHAGFCPRVA